MPEGWEWVTLPEVADICMGQSPPGSSYNEEGRGLPFFQGKADFTDYHPTIRVYCTEPKKIVKSGDILISVRAPVGPTNVADRVCTIGRGLAGLTPLAGIPTNYILYLLRYKEPEISLWGTGSTFTAINKGHLESIELPLPPLAEQHRIVAAIEALFARLDAANARLDRVPGILKQFRQSVLAAACDGRLTEDWRAEQNVVNRESPVENCEDYIAENIEIPPSWHWSNLKNICTQIVDCPHSTPRWTEEGEICLRTTNFKLGYLDLSEVRYVSRETYEERVSRLEPQPNDIVYSREGGILGIACPIPEGLKACLGQRMMLIRASQSKCSPKYLLNILNSPFVLSKVKTLTGGTSSPHLNVGDVKQFLVPLPPLPEQHEIVRRVDALFALADRIEAEVAAARGKTETMRQSILARAFSGRLVPTEAELARREGREYEPASVLLERIRSGKGAKKTGKESQSRLT